LIDNWLRHVQDVGQKHRDALAAIQGAKGELPVLRAQRDRTGGQTSPRTTVVQDAWARGQELTVHGWPTI